MDRPCNAPKPEKERIKKAPIKRVYLENPDVEAFQPAVRAIEEADIIILSPGGFYTSIIATLLVPGIRDAIARSAGATVYVSNVTTQSGQTDDYTLEKTLEVLSTYLGANAIDYVIANNTHPPEDVLAPYVERGEELLLPTPEMVASKHPVLLQGQTFQEDLVAGHVAREWKKAPCSSTAAVELLLFSTPSLTKKWRATVSTSKLTRPPVQLYRVQRFRNVCGDRPSPHRRQCWVYLQPQRCWHPFFVGKFTNAGAFASVVNIKFGLAQERERHVHISSTLASS